MSMWPPQAVSTATKPQMPINKRNRLIILKPQLHEIYLSVAYHLAINCYLYASC